MDFEKYSDDASGEAEFFQDARAMLGYGKYLNEKGIEFIEDKAYMDGHRGGYEDIYGELCNLCDIIETILKEGLK